MNRKPCPDCQAIVDRLCRSSNLSELVEPANRRLLLRVGLGEGCTHSA
jgi:hypothetical protein